MLFTRPLSPSLFAFTPALAATTTMLVSALSLVSATPAHAQDLLVGEYSSDTIWRVAPDGTKTLYAQPSAAGGTRLTSFSFDSSGNLYAARPVAFAPNDPNNGVIKVSPSGVVTSFASVLGQPFGILVRGSNDLLVGGNTSGQIRRFSLAGADLGTFATVSGNGYVIAADSSGNVYVGSDTNGQIRRFSSTGVDLGVFATTASPAGLAFDAAGNLYVANENGVINRFSSTGTSLGIFASLSGGDFRGLSFAPNGDLYAANYGGSDIRRFSSTGVSLGTFSSGIASPYGIAFIPAVTSVPEAGSLVLGALGLAISTGTMIVRRRRSRTTDA